MKVPYCKECGSNHKPASGHGAGFPDYHVISGDAYQERLEESPALARWVRWVSVIRARPIVTNAVASKLVIVGKMDPTRAS